MIGSQELGRVTRFESRMEQYSPAGGIPASGGGILLDLGAHIVDQALLLAAYFRELGSHGDPELVNRLRAEHRDGQRSPEVQRAAGRITTSNADEGFATAVDRFISRRADPLLSRC